MGGADEYAVVAELHQVGLVHALTAPVFLSR
jgi:hypothetical protein